MKKVWVEKYRPRSVEKVIMPNDRMRKIFTQWVEAGEFPSILMYGGPGTGKTSLSLALIRDCGIEKADVLKINCSDEKIEGIRGKVIGFATTMSMGGKFKVVRLEECDRLGADAQGLLRDVIESTSSNCRFIATCNYVNLLIPPLRSRFQEHAITAPAKMDLMVLAAEILEAEGVSFDEDDVEKVVSASYPDARKMIQLLEGSVIAGKLDLASGESVADWKLDLLPALEASDFKAARKIVCESATAEEIIEVFSFLYQNLHRAKKFAKVMDDAIVLINEHQHMHQFVGDKEINAAALFIQLGNLI